MEQTHADTQSALASAILAPERPAPRFLIAANRTRARNGLDVYRNNVAAGLLNVLAARFPTVRRLAGDDSFFAAARNFLAAHPPRSPVLMGYGEGFPDFVRALGSAACFPYMADLAALELARGRAYHAADADPLAPAQWTLVPADALSGKRVELHPSVSLVASRFPIVSAWRASEAGEANECGRPPIGAQAALVARPFLEVEVHTLPAGGFECLQALQRDATIAQALGAGAAAAPEFDLALILSIMIGSNIVTALR